MTRAFIARRARPWPGLRPLMTLVGPLALAGCQMLNRPATVDLNEPTSAFPQPVSAQVQHNGAIFQAGLYRPLFEDHRARLIGDTLTVQIVERVSASTSSTSTIEKKGSLEGGVTALPGINPNSFGRASVAGTSANKFEGKGDSANSNEFSGTITATVINVLPNGHLIIAGEKQIGINHTVDVLRFSGQVDPRAIQPGNSVQSAQIANVRIEHRGRGAQAEAQGIGWLARFFLSVLPV